MYKVYFKQAIAMLKQNKAISIITIIGTALAVMMIMVIISTEAIKNTDIAPESKRHRTMYLNHYEKHKKSGDNGKWSGSIPYDICKNYLSALKTPGITSMMIEDYSGSRFMVKKADKNVRFLAHTRRVDAAYWKLYDFTFVEGKGFSQEDFESGIKQAVISDKLAEKVFGNSNCLGKDIELDFKPFKVVGVVKEVSQALVQTSGEAYIPFTTNPNYENLQYSCAFLLKNIEDMKALDREFREAERKFNAVDSEWDLTLTGPLNLRQTHLNEWGNIPDESKANRKLLFIFGILLLIPAVNLSSFSISSMKKRSEEIGVRKAFGAKRYVILIQVLYENMITSLIGGVFGLIASYFMISMLKEWLLGIGETGSLPVNALVSPLIFGAVFLVCFLLNILSAGIPAYKASKINIVDSINSKKG